MISVAAVVCADGPAVTLVHELHPESGADSPLSLVWSPLEALLWAKPGPSTHTGIHLQYRTCVAVNPLAVSIRYPPVGALCKSSVLRGHFIWVYLFWFTICVNLIWDMYKNMSPRWFKKPTSKAFWKTLLKCTEGKRCFKSAKGGHNKCWFNLVNSSLLINIFSQHPYFAAFLHKCLKLLSAL